MLRKKKIVWDGGLKCDLGKHFAYLFGFPGEYYKEATAFWPLHPKYRTFLTSCCSVWNMNWQWETEWVSKWARVPASPPGCSCCPTSAPPSLTEPHKWQLQLSSVTSTPKIDGQVFLMETVTWSDFHGPWDALSGWGAERVFPDIIFKP